MSRYEELWKAFIEGETKFDQYRQDAWEFAGSFVDGLVEFLGCRPDQVRLLPPGDERDFEKTYSVAGALNHDDEGYWSMGIFLTIRNPESVRHETPALGPQAGFLFRFSIRKEKGRFQLRMPNGRHVEFDPDSVDDRAAHYDRMVADMKAIFASDFGLHGQADSVRRIGFDAARSSTSVGG